MTQAPRVPLHLAHTPVKVRLKGESIIYDYLGSSALSVSSLKTKRNLRLKSLTHLYLFGKKGISKTPITPMPTNKIAAVPSFVIKNATAPPKMPIVAAAPIIHRIPIGIIGIGIIISPDFLNAFIVPNSLIQR